VTIDCSKLIYLEQRNGCVVTGGQTSIFTFIGIIPEHMYDVRQMFGI